jgi:hypothetical protein
MVKHAKTGFLAVTHHHGDMYICNKINLYVKIMILSHSLVMTTIIFFFFFASLKWDLSVLSDIVIFI